jgi:hypothetical protein
MFLEEMHGQEVTNGVEQNEFASIIYTYQVHFFAVRVLVYGCHTCYYLKQLMFFPSNCQFLFLMLVVWLGYY